MLRKNYQFFGLFTGIYAIFITFCLYHNARGITFPFFVAGTLFYFYYSMKKCGVLTKKDDWFYLVSMMLLGISVFLTMDIRIIAISKVGIFLLLIGYLLHHFYQDSEWNFIKYITVIPESIIYVIGSLLAPIADLSFYIQNCKKPILDSEGNEIPKPESKLPYVLFGILIAIPLLFIIITALSSADIVFQNFCKRFFHILRLQNVFGILIMGICSYFLAYALLHSMTQKPIHEECSNSRTKEPVLAITFTSIISVIYFLFSIIQIVYLFAGNMTLPQNYTYAEYARQGFFQLLFVCAMNVVILLICVTLFKESKILNTILCIITICTYIMTASSAYRMYLYVSVYGFTFLRILVFFFLVVIAVLMIGILLMIFIPHFALFRYTMITLTVFTIILSYLHPDYLSAKYNAAHGYCDYDYIMDLSVDSAPVIIDYFNSIAFDTDSSFNAYSYHEKLTQQLEDPVTIRSFNVSYSIAKKAYQKFDSSKFIYSD